MVKALLVLLGAVAWLADRPEETEAVAAQLERVRAAVARGGLDATHRAELEKAHDAVKEILRRP